RGAVNASDTPSVVSTDAAQERCVHEPYVRPLGYGSACHSVLFQRGSKSEAGGTQCVKLSCPRPCLLSTSNPFAASRLRTRSLRASSLDSSSRCERGTGSATTLLSPSVSTLVV